MTGTPATGRGAEEVPPTDVTGAPLSGVRVLELGRFVAGPLAARLLADLGADVIKVESPPGDPFRTFTYTQSGDSPNFVALNRSKRSLAVDLSSEHGRKAVFECLRTADVFVENSRPGSMERLGIGYEDLRPVNPKLVYCSVTGFGDRGPYADRPGYDMIGQALSGLASQLTDPDEPRVMGPNVADSVTGMTAALGVVSALVHQRVTGKGQRLGANLVGSGLAFLGMEAQRYLDTGVNPGPFTRPASSLSFVLRCSDGGLIGLHLSSPDKFWRGLLRAFDRPELAADPRFTTHQGRQEHYEELRAALQEAFLTGPRDALVERLAAEDVPCAPVLDVAEAYESDQVKALGLQRSMESDGRRHQTVGAPIDFGSTPAPAPFAPPALGEHNRQILGEVGYDDAQLNQAMKEGWLVDPDLSAHEERC